MLTVKELIKELLNIPLDKKVKIGVEDTSTGTQVLYNGIKFEDQGNSLSIIGGLYTQKQGGDGA